MSAQNGGDGPARGAGGSARSIAWEALQRIDHEGAYANLVLPSLLQRSGLDGRDRGFVTELVYGTTRMRRACDALVDRYVVSEPKASLRSLLRLGAYQIAFGNVAAHAAVGETVQLAPKGSRPFVNAVLRRVAEGPAMVWPDEATRLSYPQWIYERLQTELGDDAVPAMERMNIAAPVSERDDGYTQDLASQWVAAALEAQPGHRVVDLCAAPGGKATALSPVVLGEDPVVGEESARNVSFRRPEARGTDGGGVVVAADRSVARAGMMAGNSARLGSRLAVVVADATAPPFLAGSFDRVLLDAPCSGFGALRRRADARWRITSAAIDELAALQARMLAAAAPLVTPGGMLVYSVCTLTAAESIDHPRPEGFDVIDDPPPFGYWRRYGHGWRLLPHDSDTDGMVLIRYRRRA